jgi:hypothetical protein
MAVWQADFELHPEDAPLPHNYQALLDALLPRTTSWAPELQMWGEEDGNRIDVWPATQAEPPQLWLRIDMRTFDPDWGSQVLSTMRALGRELFPVWRGDSPVRDPDELVLALRGSPAFRFVEDPNAFMRRVGIGGYEDA